MGEVLVNTLAKVGIKRIYSIVGDLLNAITIALEKNKAISWIHTRQEEVAAFAAGAKA